MCARRARDQVYLLAQSTRAEQEHHDQGVREAHLGPVDGAIACTLDDGQQVVARRVEDESCQCCLWTGAGRGTLASSLASGLREGKVCSGRGSRAEKQDCPPCQSTCLFSRAKTRPRKKEGGGDKKARTFAASTADDIVWTCLCRGLLDQDAVGSGARCWAGGRASCRQRTIASWGSQH